MQLVSSSAGGYHHFSGTCSLCVQDKNEYTKDMVQLLKQVVRKVRTDPTKPHPTHFDPENRASMFF
jgi:hypothetical protein